jgi:hypothetical protein
VVVVWLSKRTMASTPSSNLFPGLVLGPGLNRETHSGDVLSWPDTGGYILASPLPKYLDIEIL